MQACQTATHADHARPVLHNNQLPTSQVLFYLPEAPLLAL